MAAKDFQWPDDLGTATGRSTQIPAVQTRPGRLGPRCPSLPDDSLMVNGWFRHKAEVELFKFTARKPPLKRGNPLPEADVGYFELSAQTSRNMNELPMAA